MNWIEKKVYCIVNHFDYDKYWKMRDIVVNPECKASKIIKYIYLFRCKRMESYSNASMGTYINRGAVFEGHPSLPHGLRGIFISDKAVIGKNVTLYQQTCVGVLGRGKPDLAPVVGDNVIIGAGAKVLGGSQIGRNVRIGANAIVCQDVPDNSTVVLEKPRIISKIVGWENGVVS